MGRVLVVRPAVAALLAVEAAVRAARDQERRAVRRDPPEPRAPEARRVALAPPEVGEQLGQVAARAPQAVRALAVAPEVLEQLAAPDQVVQQVAPAAPLEALAAAAP